MQDRDERGGATLGWVGIGRMGYALVTRLKGSAPRVIVASTTVSPGASDEVRIAARERDTALLAAPPTFTPKLLLKDFQLGSDAARELGVPLPLAAAAQQVVQALVGHGYTDVDFAALIEQQARAAGLDLVSEDAPVDDGLGPPRREPVSGREDGG